MMANNSCTVLRHGLDYVEINVISIPVTCGIHGARALDEILFRVEVEGHVQRGNILWRDTKTFGSYQPAWAEGWKFAESLMASLTDKEG